MSSGSDSASSDSSRGVYCKVYHSPIKATSSPRLRSRTQNKSTCPPWASNELLQQALINEALEDTRQLKDYLGRPLILWNAVAGEIFVGRSNNTEKLEYNCYPERPPDGKLIKELKRRASRTVEEVLSEMSTRNG